MKPICIYHANCADGFAAAWVFWKRFGASGIDLHPGVYKTPPPAVKGRKVFMADFSYKRQAVEGMVAEAESVTLIDHHKTALEDLDGLLPMEHSSLEHSGAVLAWKFCFPHIEPPKLLRHIEDHDLWRFAIPGTREIQAALFSYPYDFIVWDRLIEDCENGNGLRRLKEQGEAIERKHHKDIAELVGVCKREMVIAGHWVPVASLPYTLVSDAAHLMCEPYASPNLQGEMVTPPFAACYWDLPDGRQFGLRSLENGADVGEIAKTYDGGGHKHASGFKVPREHELARA